MKTIICIFLVLAIRFACAQTYPPEHQWTATLKAVDDTGQPVAGAKVFIDYSVYKEPISGLTDTNGIFIATHRDATEDLGFRAEKNGYYPYLFEYVKGSYDVARWNPTQTIILKKKTNPIPMYAKKVNLGMPVFDKPAGFDLMMGDWIAPYGKGVNADLMFTGHLENNSEGDTDYKLTIAFPKNGDGIQEFSAPANYQGIIQGSELRSAQEAPADGYQAEWIQTSIRKPGKPIETSKNVNRNYYFRVHTKLDESGNVVSARYGKIYGDFMQFSYYLNPTPNDRNIEFDPKKNLMTNLKPNEGVSQP